MKKTGRYDTYGLIENQYEPGSNEQVLRNLLGIKSKQEIGKVEVRELLRVTNQMTEYYDDNHCFTAADICYMHHSWLGSISDLKDQKKDEYFEAVRAGLERDYKPTV